MTSNKRSALDQEEIDDDDEEVIPIAEVQAWKAKGLEGTFVPATKKHKTLHAPQSARQPQKKDTIEASPLPKRAQALKVSVIQAVTTAFETTLEAPANTKLAAVRTTTEETETLRVVAAVTATDSTTFARLRLTVLGGSVGEAVTSVFIPAVLAACSNSHLQLGTTWWGSSFIFNVTGAFMDGGLSIVEEQGTTDAFEKSGSRAEVARIAGVAAAASCVRGGFLAAYTSFAGMAMDAALLITPNQYSDDCHLVMIGSIDSRGGSFAIGAAFIAFTLFAGAAAFAVGRSIAQALFLKPLPPRGRLARSSSDGCSLEAADYPQAMALAEAMGWLAAMAALFLTYTGVESEEKAEAVVSLAVCMLASSVAVLVGALGVFGEGAWATENANVAAVTGLAAAVLLKLSFPGFLQARNHTSAVSSLSASLSLPPQVLLLWDVLSVKILSAAFTGPFCGACSDFNGAARATLETAKNMLVRSHTCIGTPLERDLPPSSLPPTPWRRLAINAGVATVGALSIAAIMMLLPAVTTTETVAATAAVAHFGEMMPNFMANRSPSYKAFVDLFLIIAVVSCTVMAVLPLKKRQKEKVD